MWDSRSHRPYFEPPLGLVRSPFTVFLQLCRSSFAVYANDLKLEIQSSGLRHHWLRKVRKIRSDEDLNAYMLIAPSSRPPLFLYCKQAVSSSSSTASLTSFDTPPASPEKATVEAESSRTSNRNSGIQQLFHEAIVRRDKNKCLISGQTDGLEAAHVYPLNVGIIPLQYLQFSFFCDSLFAGGSDHSFHVHSREL